MPSKWPCKKLKKKKTECIPLIFFVVRYQTRKWSIGFLSTSLRFVSNFRPLGFIICAAAIRLLLTQTFHLLRTAEYMLARVRFFLRARSRFSEVQLCSRESVKSLSHRAYKIYQIVSRTITSLRFLNKSIFEELYCVQCLPSFQRWEMIFFFFCYFTYL